MAIAFAHDGAFTHRNGFHNVGVTIGVFSDLRNSGHLHDAALWKAAVADDADAELIRAYVARRRRFCTTASSRAPRE